MKNLISSGIRKLVKTQARYTPGTKTAKVIAVATVKGGVGKTTTSVNLACGLARFAEARVLLVDLDAQGHCSLSLASSLPTHKNPDRISDVILDDDERELLDVAVPSGIRRLDITLPDANLGEAEGRISQKIGKEFLLRDAIRITRTHYDYIVVDCPPNKGNLTLNAMLAADHIVVPTDLSPLAVQGADELLGTIQTVNSRLNHSINLLGIVLTRVDSRNVTMNEAILDQIKEAWGEHVFDTQIGINTALARAQLEGKPIYEFDGASRGAKHYEALTREVLSRLAH
ncbi:ParA family protein [Microvenator marinus]|uniref:ParA family protein n=1 Tax=Microvenator marinus TaxID=2600177 RepID=A0A5B8XNS2_9DELT|nr:ParA family protein [Microvenator marinus]QED26891.1 ParA family protein [Microvenator marinus]